MEARFNQASPRPVVAHSDCRRIGNALFCARPSDPPKALSCAWARPQELDHWFCSRNLRLSWMPSGIAFRSDCQMTCRGSNLYSMPPDQRVVEFYLLQNPRIKFNKPCGVWILFGTPKLRTAVSWYQPSSTRLMKRNSTCPKLKTESLPCTCSKNYLDDIAKSLILPVSSLDFSLELTRFFPQQL